MKPSELTESGKLCTHLIRLSGSQYRSVHDIIRAAKVGEALKAFDLILQTASSHKDDSRTPVKGGLAEQWWFLSEHPLPRDAA